MGTPGGGTILSSPEAKSSSKRVVWAVVIVILLAVLLGGYFWIRRGPTPTQRAEAPVAPTVAPAPPPPEPVKDTIHFAFDKFTLSPEEEGKVKAFWEKITGKKGQITIEGHTCSLGSEWYNQRLSVRRAERVARVLEAPEGYVLKVAAYGKTTPVADNSTREGRAANRRAEVIFTPTS